MRCTLCVFTLFALTVPAGAANNTVETRRLLEQMDARASKVRFEAAEVAEYLRKGDSNLALVEKRLEWMQSSAEDLRRLFDSYQAAAQPDAESSATLDRLRQAVEAVHSNVDETQGLVVGRGAEKQRKAIRQKAKETAELSDSIRAMTARLAN